MTQEAVASVPPSVRPKRIKSKRNAVKKAAEEEDSTPWLTGAAAEEEVTLSREIVAFSNFIRLSAAEASVRLACIKRTSAAARAEFGPQVIVMPYGSFVSQTMVSSSSLDLSIHGMPLVTQAIMENFLTRAGADVMTCVEDPSGRTGFTQAKAWEGFLVNITCHAVGQANTAVTSNQVTSQWMAQFPQSVHTHAVLRQLLDQTKNMDVCKGGMSSYALLVMVISVCRLHPSISAASLLIEFCRMFGTVFNFATQAVSSKSGCVIRPCVASPASNYDSADDQVFIEDPTDPTNNLGAGCTRISSIKAQFRHCFKTLQRWNVAQKAQASPVPTHTPAKALKGKTPLSGIIGCQLLWGRAELLKKAVPRKVAELGYGLKSSDVPILGAPGTCDTRSTVSLRDESEADGSEPTTETHTESASSNGLTSHSSQPQTDVPDMLSSLCQILRAVASRDSLSSLEDALDDADDFELLRQTMDHEL
eukprot:gene4297-6640_t